MYTGIASPRWSFSLHSMPTSMNTTDGNEMTSEQVAIANNKGWKAFVHDGYVDEFRETAGYWLIDERNFPDENFREYLADYGFYCVSAITMEEINDMDELCVESAGVKDFTGVELFTEVSKILVSSNELTSLDLSHNKKVSYLDVSNNYIKSTEMTKLIASLPTLQANTGRLTVRGRCDQNEFTDTHLAQAKAKGWVPYVFESGEWIEFTSAGSVATGISDISADKSQDDNWYTLDGRQLNEAPTHPGLYIRDGKKVQVK